MGIKRETFCQTTDCPEVENEKVQILHNTIIEAIKIKVVSNESFVNVVPKIRLFF